jgi:hypothetical protein
MAQNIENLKSEINSFKCGLRAMLGEEDQESQDFDPNLYKVDKEIQSGR